MDCCYENGPAPVPVHFTSTCWCNPVAGALSRICVKADTFFSGSAILDSFWGACIGSILTGNPINSYVIGKNLLDIGVGLSGVTALLLTWVSVGLIQLPVESKALGIRFALVRNIAGFIVAVIMSFVVVWFTGGRI